MNDPRQFRFESFAFGENRRNIDIGIDADSLEPFSGDAIIRCALPRRSDVVVRALVFRDRLDQTLGDKLRENGIGDIGP